MNWKIVKYRSCNGSCCIHSPRFPRTGSRLGVGPNVTRIRDADCIYHLNQPGERYGGCVLYKEHNGEIRRDKLPRLSVEERDLFTRTCLNWPLPDQNYDKVYSDAEREAMDLDFGEGICCHRWEPA